LLARVRDATPFSGGVLRSKSSSLLAQFEREQTYLGELHIDITATRLLGFANEILPHHPVISSRDQDCPPEWLFSSNAFLSRGPWHMGLDIAHVGSGRYANAVYSAFTTVGARVGYRLGKRLQLEFGMQNLLDADPPRLDTVTGFRGEAPLGRTYELRLATSVGG
jgi:hypothetical protein